MRFGPEDDDPITIEIYAGRKDLEAVPTIGGDAEPLESFAPSDDSLPPPQFDGALTPSA
jgi:hypothetical protein